MFPPRINDDLGPVGQGVMGARFYRCDDGLTYIGKDDPIGRPYIRATELFWSKIGTRIGLPFLSPKIISDRNGRTIFATRREKNLAAVSHVESLHFFITGAVNDGGRQIARIYGFDLFCGNEDRKPDNYLLLNEDHGLVLQGIDFGHSALIPGVSTWPETDPLFQDQCHTRRFFPELISEYQSDRTFILETIDRIEGLQLAEIETILNHIPDEWLALPLRHEIREWWRGDSKAQRLDAIRAGIFNGTLLNGTIL